MKKSELVSRRKVAILSTVRLMKALAKDLIDNQKTFNRLLIALDKLTDNDTSEMDIDFDSALSDLDEWESAVSKSDWP